MIQIVDFDDLSFSVLHTHLRRLIIELKLKWVCTLKVKVLFMLLHYAVYSKQLTDSVILIGPCGFTKDASLKPNPVFATVISPCVVSETYVCKGDIFTYKAECLFPCIFKHRVILCRLFEYSTCSNMM